MDKKINVIFDLEGNEIIIINDIRFKGKRRIDWENVEQMQKLRQMQHRVFRC